MSRALVSGMPFLVAIGFLHCVPSNVIRPEPSVKFVAPEGTVLYIQRGSGAVRVRFEGKRRLAPMVCSATGALLRTAGRSPSLLHTLDVLSRHTGFARVQLHGPGGKLLAKGTLCIFPTMKTSNRSILSHYTIRIPPEVIARLRAGKHASAFETYRPLKDGKPGWNHIAWVIFLRPQP